MGQGCCPVTRMVRWGEVDRKNHLPSNRPRVMGLQMPALAARGKPRSNRLRGTRAVERLPSPRAPLSKPPALLGAPGEEALMARGRPPDGLRRVGLEMMGRGWIKPAPAPAWRLPALPGARLGADRRRARALLGRKGLDVLGLPWRVDAAAPAVAWKWASRATRTAPLAQSPFFWASGQAPLPPRLVRGAGEEACPMMERGLVGAGIKR